MADTLVCFFLTSDVKGLISIDRLQYKQNESQGSKEKKSIEMKRKRLKLIDHQSEFLSIANNVKKFPQTTINGHMTVNSKKKKY